MKGESSSKRSQLHAVRVAVMCSCYTEQGSANASISEYYAVQISATALALDGCHVRSQ